MVNDQSKEYIQYCLSVLLVFQRFPKLQNWSDICAPEELRNQYMYMKNQLSGQNWLILLLEYRLHFIHSVFLPLSLNLNVSGNQDVFINSLIYKTGKLSLEFPEVLATRCQT